MNSLPPLERQWVLLRTLSARRFGATVKELAEGLGTSLKTIRRDLDLLRDLGFPISPSGGAHGRNHWVAEFDSSAPPLTFDVSEILALYLGRTLLEPLAGTLIWESHYSAFRKIKATLKEPIIDYLDQLQGLVFRTTFRNSVYQNKSEIIDSLMIGIEERRITFLTYHSAKSTEPLTYDVYPYGLVFHRGSLYLVAHSQQHDQIRTFKLDRVEDVQLETLKFQKPPDFDLQTYLQHSLGVFHVEGEPQRVVVRFSKEVARYVTEHRWHESQSLTKQSDGTLLAEFFLTSLEELKSWVLSFGSKAVVEEPQQLREQIQEELERMVTAYKSTNANYTSARQTRYANLPQSH
ncbi:helix-turn-helix transcriptional regulator [Planctomicrobium sp. SH527]|uniref:helix-turn-helix transcriptional regulator n=1 Tax=Planctomicrobium sp. SH527 TaxID=3448123 RepID=UPI003F5C9D72